MLSAYKNAHRSWCLSPMKSPLQFVLHIALMSLLDPSQFALVAMPPSPVFASCLLLRCNNAIFSHAKGYTKAQLSSFLATNSIIDIIVNKMLIVRIFTTISTSNLPMGTLQGWDNTLVPQESPRISEFQWKPLELS